MNWILTIIFIITWAALMVWLSWPEPRDENGNYYRDRV